MTNIVLAATLTAALSLPMVLDANAGQVGVPGAATGDFGQSPGGATNGSQPFVLAATVGVPGTITIKYISGLVDYGGPGPAVTADGGLFGASPNAIGWALPLDESAGITSAAYPTRNVTHHSALIGAFIPNSRATVAGFQAVDATKFIAAAGILPSDLFFVGQYHVIAVNQPGRLYLGINDSYAGDNSGAFTVSVSSP